MVDASGRSSQLPQWLDAVGVTPPSPQCISAGLGYGSRTYAMPENWFQEKVPAHPLPCADLTTKGRAGSMIPVPDLITLMLQSLPDSQNRSDLSAQHTTDWSVSRGWHPRCD